MKYNLPAIRLALADNQPCVIFHDGKEYRLLSVNQYPIDDLYFVGICLLVSPTTGLPIEPNLLVRFSLDGQVLTVE